MASREKVLSVYPEATLTAEAFEGWCIYEGGPRPNNRLTGFHLEFEAAWDELASKLPPGSPAGETASAPKCESCGTIYSDGHTAWCDAVPEPVPTEEAAGKEGFYRMEPVPGWSSDGPCKECGYPCEVWFAPNDIWNQVVPERTGLLCLRCFARLAKGITKEAWKLAPEFAAAPEAAAGRLTYDDCTKADADAAEQWAVAYVCKVGVSRETMIDAISTLRSQVMAYERRSAAPIAPAAEETLYQKQDRRTRLANKLIALDREIFELTYRTWDRKGAKK